mgnify:CR=1 FL=1
MNKLERAISLTMSDDMNNMYSHCDSEKSIEEISKMEDENTLSENSLLEKKIIFQGSNQDKLVNQLRDIRTALNKNKSKSLIMIASMTESCKKPSCSNSI